MKKSESKSVYYNPLLKKLNDPIDDKILKLFFVPLKELNKKKKRKQKKKPLKFFVIIQRQLLQEEFVPLNHDKLIEILQKKKKEVINLNKKK